MTLRWCFYSSMTEIPIIYNKDDMIGISVSNELIVDEICCQLLFHQHHNRPLPLLENYTFQKGTYLSTRAFRHITKSSSAAACTRRRLSNTSTSPHVHFDIWQSHHQLQYALDVSLATQALLHTCVSTYNKVIISCRSH